MSSTFKNWTSDNYAFVGKAFDFAYADRLNKLSPVVGEVNAKSIDYELTGSGGYGEAPRYDGENLNEGSLKRGFKTVITPVEYTLSIPVGYKEAKVDKMGETKKVGTKLGDSMALTVYLHVLRMFANAWNTDGKHNGGDGVSWANAAHPVASRGLGPNVCGRYRRRYILEHLHGRLLRFRHHGGAGSCQPFSHARRYAVPV